MRRYALVLALVGAPFAALAAETPKAAPPDAAQPEEYAVYNAALTALLKPGRPEKAGPYVICDRTGSRWPDHLNRLRKGDDLVLTPRDGRIEAVDKPSRETIGDFLDKNSKGSIRIGRDLDPKVRFTLATPEELDKAFGDRGTEEDPWKRFYARYVGARGLVTLSRVGFNKERTQALVGVAVGSGGLAGEGVLVLLVKEKGAWVAKAVFGVWVS